MKLVLERYLAVLRVELEDLRHDIEFLLSDCAEGFREHNITERVFYQNQAVFLNEGFGVSHFIDIVDSTSADDFETLDDLIAHLRRTFDAEIARSGLAPAARVFAERKIIKVQSYVTHCYESAD